MLSSEKVSGKESADCEHKCHSHITGKVSTTREYHYKSEDIHREDEEKDGKQIRGETLCLIAKG